MRAMGNKLIGLVIVLVVVVVAVGILVRLLKLALIIGCAVLAFTAISHALRGGRS
jgi:hypothetical protein